MNNVSLIGRLTKDVEMRYTPAGKAVSNFTLAVNRAFKNAEGQYEADFIMVQVWGKTAESAANYLKKGSQAGVVGRIQTRNYDDQQGKRVYVTEVVAESVSFLDPKSSSNGQGQGQQQQQQQRPPQGNPYQQQNQNNGQYQQNQQNNHQNYSRVDEDPFSTGSGPISLSDDDLPF